MSKFIKAVGIIAVSVGLLTGCGSSSVKQELEKNDANKATAKVDQSSNVAGQSAPKNNEQKKDIWTYYNDAKWSEDFNGLKMEIQKVVASDKGPKIEGGQIKENEFNSYVGVKFKMENTTKGKFTAYPDQAKLVTSTGEQIEIANMFLSDHLGGEIDEGVIKEGNVIWQLKRGHAEDISWVKIEWGAHVGGDTEFDKPRKEFSVKLDLKK